MAMTDAAPASAVRAATPDDHAALLSMPKIGGPVGYSGGIASIGVRLAAVEPRIVAAGLFAGSFIPKATFEDARQVRIRFFERHLRA